MTAINRLTRPHPPHPTLPRTLRHALWPSLSVRPLRGPVAYPQPGAERGFRLSTPHRYYPFKTSKTTPSVDISQNRLISLHAITPQPLLPATPRAANEGRTHGILGYELP
jgi:hypothetical protein